VSNPIPADEASVTRGEEIYMGTCVDCHGEGGKGDGPVAARQNPKPADFNADFVKNLTDGELYYIIINGVEGTGMMSWAVYDEDKRGHLVNYIRSLQE
jgi:mono/diheme cytochrome c family protein